MNHTILYWKWNWNQNKHHGHALKEVLAEPGHRVSFLVSCSRLYRTLDYLEL